MSSEIKVGLLFFLGVAVALWFTLYVNRVGGGNGAYLVHFNRVVRLKEGDQVTYNGVRVGTVTEVAPDRIDGKPMVRVGFSLDKARQGNVLIDADTAYMINQGLLGGSQLEIRARQGQPITPALLAGFKPVGVDPAGIDEAVAAVKQLIDDNAKGIQEAIGSVRTGMDRFGNASEEIRGMVAENRPGIQRAVGSLGDAGAAVAKLIDENRPAIDQAIAAFRQAAAQIAALVEENRPDLRLTIGRLPTTVENLGQAAAQVRDAVAENRPSLKETLENAAKFSRDLEAIGKDVRQVTGEIASGRGTIGKLVFSDQLHDRALAAVDSLEQRLEEVKPVTQGLGELKFYAGVLGGIDATYGPGVGYAYLRIEPKPWKFYEGGVSYRTAPFDRDATRDDPDKLGIDLNVLIGWRFLPDDDAGLYRLTVAGGFIDSHLGGLVQVPVWGDRVRLTAMVRGKNYNRDERDRRFEDGAILVRAWGEVRIWERVSVILGGNDLSSDRPGAWVGLRAEMLDNDLRNLTSVSSLAP